MPSAQGSKAEQFYKSMQWRNASEAYRILRHGRCEICGRSARLVHHKTPITAENVDNPEITLNFDNFMLLCQPCHNRIHADMAAGLEEKTTIARFDENGNVVIYEKQDTRKDNEHEQEKTGT